MRTYFYLREVMKEFFVTACQKQPEYKKILNSKEFWTFVDEHADEIDTLLGYKDHEWADFMDIMDQISYETSFNNPNISDEEEMEADKNLEKILDDLHIYSYRENNEYQTLHYDSEALKDSILYMSPFYHNRKSCIDDLETIIDYYKRFGA